MVKAVNHITIIVSDIGTAKEFFSLLGFKEKSSIILSEAEISNAMGVEHTKGDHVALSLQPSIRDSMEIQLLRYEDITPKFVIDGVDAVTGRSCKIRFDHLALEVDDIDAEMERLKKHGVKFLTDTFIVHRKKLAFLVGPDGVTLELAQLLPLS